MSRMAGVAQMHARLQHECPKQADLLHVSVSHSLTSAVRGELSTHRESLVVPACMFPSWKSNPTTPRRHGHGLCILHGGDAAVDEDPDAAAAAMRAALAQGIFHGLQAPTRWFSALDSGLKGPLAAWNCCHLHSGVASQVLNLLQHLGS